MFQSQKLNSIKKFFRKILQNSFIKISSKNGIISFASSLLTMISTKVVALIVGTSGVAMIGQLQNFIQIITLISNGGFNQGVTKYVAQDKDDEKSLLRIIGTAFLTLVVSTISTTILILIFSKFITLKIFTSTTYVSIIIIFAVTLIFYNVNSLILAIVNGFQDYSRFFRIKITTTIVGFVLTTSFVLLFKEYGALLAIILSQSVVCVFAYRYVRNENWLKAFFKKYFDKQKLLLLLKYTAITVFAAAAWPIVKLIIRTYVINNISAEEAGLWQATANINRYIVNIAVGSFSIYLLPKFSSLDTKDKLIKELIGIYKIIIPITIIGFTVIYVLRDYVIMLLYSKEFLKVGHYLLLQMIGSFFWMCKVPIMNYMLAKAHTTIYMINELIFALIYIVLAMFLIPKYQVQGIQLAFAIYNFLYFITNIFLIRMLLKKVWSKWVVNNKAIVLASEIIIDVRHNIYMVNIVIPMVGLGKRFTDKEDFTSKGFMNVVGKPMFVRVIENLQHQRARFFIIARKEDAQLKIDLVEKIKKKYDVQLILIDVLTEWTACTVLHAREQINNDIPLLIAIADQIIHFDFEEFLSVCSNSQIDGNLICFPQKEPNISLSHAKVNESGYVSLVKEKEVISDLATVGIYYYSKGKYFVNGAIDMIINNERVNNEFYVAPTYNYLISNNMKISTYNIDKHQLYDFGTEENFDSPIKKLF